MKFTIDLKNKKLLKKILAISLPLFVVGASITTYVIKTNNNKDTELVNNAITIENGVKKQVYLLTKDNQLMPITVTIEKKDFLADEIVELVNLMKEDSSLINDNIKNIISKDSELKNVTIEDKTITLNFNENFNYDVKNEKRVLESLVWTCLQYDEFDNLKLQINDVELTHMPLNNTLIPETLNKNIGINNHLFVGRTNQKSVNVLYEKTIEDSKYYIPVTVKVDSYLNKYQEVIEGLDLKMPLYTNLTNPNIINKIEVLEYNNLDENNNLNLTLSPKALYDEKTIDSKVYEYLVMNLMFNDDQIETVSITVNDELVAVNGYEESNIQVNSITFNEIKV